MANLNFEGGPWKLRNGEVVHNLISTLSDGGYITKDKPDIWWDSWGNGWGANELLDSRSDHDIMESCLNWKYLRMSGKDV